MEKEMSKEDNNNNKNNNDNDNNGYHYHYDNDEDVFSGSFGSERERSPATVPSSLGYIEHSVSKFDTLAGIAIKYGVELFIYVDTLETAFPQSGGKATYIHPLRSYKVADVKKMNGLVTDHQMFALKTVHIPLPGRHPPSPCLPSGSGTTGQGSSDHSPSDHAHRELFESFQSLRVKSSERKVSPAMSSLQGYYGLKSTSNSTENGSTKSSRPLSYHRKSKSLVNVILEEIMEKADTEPAAEVREGDSDKWNDKLSQRRQKSEADFTRIPELLLKEDISSSAVLPSRTGKRLALRQKSASRTALTNDSESSGLNPVAAGMGDASLVTDGSSGVRKSSSTSCLQDQENSCSSSIWPTSMWSLKPDLQGLPKPNAGRKNKAALD